MKILESKSDDMKRVKQLAFHLDNPCGTYINGKGVNLERMYLRLARDELSSQVLKDPLARLCLLRKVNFYLK
ncbi:hypothetical protein BMS3Abin17_01245 [archaeon BMS3Abin17]|nr:hypothetical protein BMS3Abin17_01245 [archaeon BMS3Abin17]HDZ60582.1 hypothetical protein [Candidatus Pacearchaeota archaeon]